MAKKKHPKGSGKNAKKPAGRHAKTRERPAKAQGAKARAGGRATAVEKAKPAPPKGKGEKPEPKAKSGAPAKAPAGAKAALGPDGKPLKDRAKAPGRKSSRRPTLLRRGPDGEILAPGDLLLPGGAQRIEEVQYLFRGCTAGERPSVGEEAVGEVFARRPAGDFPTDRDELQRLLHWARDRFEHGSIEPVIPTRTNVRRSFQGVVERARHRRREIGAFLRGLDLGHTETSHMDAHGEASLQSLMEWAARLENLAEADEPNQADYAQFHRGLDQLESTTEALIIDVEQTLRRLRDRLHN